MGLHLHYLPSVAPYLDDILSPLIRRHIDFKLRDSFRILTPDVESRQDLEQVFLENEALGGVLIGKSLLTLHSFAQALLLEHPAPGVLASLPIQRKALRSALAIHQPNWKLDNAALQKCLTELQEWRRLDASPKAGRMAPIVALDAEFQRTLESLGKNWLLDRSLKEAWKLLALGGGRELASVEEFYLIGFRRPEPALLFFLEALRRGYPSLQIHLFLPPRDKVVDVEGHFEIWRRRLESLAESLEALTADPPAAMSARPWATPVHEADGLVGAWLKSGEVGRILVPGFSPVSGILEAELRAKIAPHGSAGPVFASATQIPAFLVRELEARPDQEVSVTFEAVMQSIRPIFAGLQKSLAENGDLESLRFLEAYRRWFLDCEQAEILKPEFRPWKDWIAELKEDLTELRLPATPGVQRRLPLRRLDRAGIMPLKHLWIAGMNEGAFPSSPAPAFFEEEALRFLKTHEEELCLQQALFLGLENISFSYSEFSLSGRALLPSPTLSDLPSLEWISERDPKALSSAQGHPYFAENVGRERKRQEDAGGIDVGDLQNLGLEGAILAKLQEKPLSATYLDDFAKCPWRFFARWHLQLKEEIPEDLEIEPKRRGGLMHRLLEEAVRDLSRGYFDQGKIPTLLEVEASLKLVFEALQASAVADPSPVPRVLVLDQLERLRRSASALLGEEHLTWSEAPEKLLPRHLEWSFGRGGKNPLMLQVDPVTHIPLTGAVDRIDVSADGKRFLLIDYKSSRSEDLAKEIRDGQSLQLWIYLQAVKRLLLPQSEALGGLYWDVKEVKKNQGIARREAFQPYHHRKIPHQSRSFMKEEEFEKIDRDLEDKTVAILKRILAGDYVLRPEKCLGAYCEFREICRYDEKPRN